ncbi:hypothetical protein ABW20_dc0109304 [Dactylellina cionopaga]|nr:hypothetical protein ABW20_dc0109304 [Dactylellina cionopaga]
MAIKHFLLFAALVAGSQAQELFPLSKRAACDSDNALRNLKDKRYSSSASIFCSAWLQSTITNTLSVTATSSATTTETPPADTAVVSETVTVTNTETTVTTEYPTAVNTFVKRGDDVPYPTWLTTAYAPSRVSSACSCFITSPSAPVVLTATTTIATQTNTATVTLSPLTNTVTTFFTDTASATATQVITGPEIPCGATGCSNAVGFIDATLEASTAEACKTFCQGNSSCKSFQFGLIPDYSVCHIFETEVAETYANGYSTDEGCTPFKFYDVKCIV